MPVVLVQKGHVAPRQPGFEKATGAEGEQGVVTVLANEIAKALALDKRFVCRVIPGQVPGDVQSGAYNVDAFIALHCDGGPAARRGWGIGYPSGTVNRALANEVGKEIAKIHPSARIRDNYTDDMSGYYAYSRVPTDGPEILVENGFVSNEDEKKWMLENAGKIASAYYRALLAFFGLPAKQPKPADSWITPEEARAAWEPGMPLWQTLPGPSPKPAWVWERDLELQRRKAVLRAAAES